MSNHLFFKGIAVMLLFLYFPFLNAQVDNVNFSQMFKNQLKFSTSPLLYDNLIFNNVGEKLIKSRYSFSGEVSLSYYQYIKKGIGFNIGTGFGIAPLNFNYNFKSPPNSVFQTGPYKNDYKYLENNTYMYNQDLYVFFFSAQKSFPNKKKTNLFYNIELGIKLNKKIAFPYEITSEYTYIIDDSTEVKQFDFYLHNNENKNIISYFFKLGLFKLTKRGNSLHYNFIFHFSPQNIGSGWYKFYELNYESYGTVKQTINYIGIEFTYGLTLFKMSNKK